MENKYTSHYRAWQLMLAMAPKEISAHHTSSSCFCLEKPSWFAAGWRHPPHPVVVSWQPQWRKGRERKEEENKG